MKKLIIRQHAYSGKWSWHIVGEEDREEARSSRRFDTVDDAVEHARKTVYEAHLDMNSGGLKKRIRIEEQRHPAPDEIPF